MVGADAAGGDDHGLGGEFEGADRLTAGGDAPGRVVLGEDRAADAACLALLDHQLVDLVTVVEGEQSVAGGLLRVLHEGFDDSGAGAPGDVEARDGVAVAVGAQVAAFGPADGGEQFDAVALQPGSLLAGGELDVGAGPADRPGVLVVDAVEAGAALPVVPGQVEGVLDAEAALFRRVDEEQSAEGPEGLPAEVVGVLLVDEGDPASPAGQFMGRDQTGQTGSDDDDVRIHGDRCPSQVGCHSGVLPLSVSSAVSSCLSQERARSASLSSSSWVVTPS